MDDATLEALAQALYLDAYPDVPADRINESANWGVLREAYLHEARLAAEFLEAHAPREYGARMLDTGLPQEIVVPFSTEGSAREVATLAPGWEVVSRRAVSEWEPVVTPEQRRKPCAPLCPCLCHEDLPHDHPDRPCPGKTPTS